MNWLSLLCRLHEPDETFQLNIVLYVSKIKMLDKNHLVEESFRYLHELLLATPPLIPAKRGSGSGALK